MNETQTSETMKLGAVITLAGGFMDAYSYICRGKVFANAQTGNLLLLGINLFERKWGLALSYCVPVVAFSMGIGIIFGLLPSYKAANLKPIDALRRE